MKQYKAVLYDLDGTLLDTYEMNMIPLRRIIREELGEDRTLEQLRPFYSQPGLKTMKDLGIQDVDGVYARWVEYVNNYEKGAVPYPGVEQILQTFHAAGIRQAVVSSKMHKQYRIDMDRYGLDQYMQTAVLAEDTILHKPHPDPILECLRRMDLSPDDAIYIGDAQSDLEAARNAGVDFGFAGWSAGTVGSAVYHFNTPEDMLQLLK